MDCHVSPARCPLAILPRSSSRDSSSWAVRDAGVNPAQTEPWRWFLGLQSPVHRVGVQSEGSEAPPPPGSDSPRLLGIGPTVCHHLYPLCSVASLGGVRGGVLRPGRQGLLCLWLTLLQKEIHPFTTLFLFQQGNRLKLVRPHVTV